ncbi:hypothetical protein [Actinokineospora sp. NBRC 105648]|uniref:hypothetical protein n=1 Tax=Actinokineospora sp. NBRC 105648 TaxID=3032206 RepID=UPI0024A4DD6D|nr:hypothetical protein [Actinokineospora sp. NBRC 105648]GLZ42274.1 hypothetical protein Acsp05_58980 [Actinokineospora sp. NBRC 105648]
MLLARAITAVTTWSGDLAIELVLDRRDVLRVPGGRRLLTCRSAALSAGAEWVVLSDHGPVLAAVLPASAPMRTGLAIVLPAASTRSHLGVLTRAPALWIAIRDPQGERRPTVLATTPTAASCRLLAIARPRVPAR